MAARKDTATVDLKVRMKESVRAELEKAARANGVSMNAEAVKRLEKSFQQDTALPDLMALAYGPRLAALLLMIGATMRAAGTVTAGKLFEAQLYEQDDWLDYPYAYDRAVEVAEHLFAAARPEGDSTPDYFEEETIAKDRELTWKFARDTINAIKEPGGRSAKHWRQAEKLNELAGELAERLSVPPTPSQEDSDDGTR